MDENSQIEQKLLTIESLIEELRKHIDSKGEKIANTAIDKVHDALDIVYA